MVTVMAEKKMMTVEGLKKLEDELHERKVIIRKEIADKIKEAREQGDLSENAEYDAARDEQRDNEAKIEELENLIKNAVVSYLKGSGVWRGDGVFYRWFRRGEQP